MVTDPPSLRSLRLAGRACLLAGPFLLPFSSLVPGLEEFFPGIYLWDRQRIIQAVLLLAGLLVLVCVSLGKNGQNLLSFRLLAAWAGIATITFYSAATAHYAGPALLDWAWMHGLFCLMLLSAWSFGEVSGKTGADCWLAPAGLVTVLYVFWFFVSNSDYLFSYDFHEVQKVFPGFSNTRYFSDFQAVLLFVAPLAVMRYLPGGRGQVFGWFLVGLLYMLAFVAGARSILVGQGVAHALLLLFFRKSYWPLLSLYLRVWVLGFALYVAIAVIYAPWSIAIGGPDNGGADVPSIVADSKIIAPRLDTSGRGELLEKSLRLIATAPWLGIGGRHYGCYLKEDFADPHNRNNGDASHPHNALLQIVVEWGGVVALALMFAFGGLLFRLARQLRKNECEPEKLDYALIGALLALCTHAMVTGVLNAPVSQMLLVLLFGWCLRRADIVPTNISCPRSTWPVAVFSLGLICCIALLIVGELEQLPASNKAYLDEQRVTWYITPRFWQQGWLLPLCGKI